MKVKKEGYLQSRELLSTTRTLLRPPNLKNSSDPNEHRYVPWYTSVPSITYLWTHRPQWRRRHKTRKKARTQRFPLKFINSGENEEELWDILKPQERPCSRSSTSPYEIGSCRQIVTESELMRNVDEQRNREIYGMTSNQRNNSFDRKGSICETCSDSGLQHSRGTKLLRLVRSQKRLGVRNSVNSQNTVGTLNSLEVNRSLLSSTWKGLQSDCNIPKRRVTFSNYVSETSATDVRCRISSIIMTDSDSSEAPCWQRSYVRLTDDEDNCSIQTDLSCLISSMIFNETESSVFSPTPATSSEIQKKCKSNLNEECSDSFFYVNSSYSNGSSCNFLSLSKTLSIEDFKESNECLFIKRNCSDDQDFTKKNMRAKLSQLSLSNKIISDIKISEEVKTEPCSRAPRTVDFTKKKLRENQSESNQIVPDIKVRDNKLREKLNSTNQLVPDIKIRETIKTDSTYSSIECITIKLRDISSTVKEVTIESRDDSDKEWRYASMQKNNISTDTSDLIALNIIPLLDSMTELLKNDVDKGRLSVNEIVNFLQQPTKSLDTSFLVKEFTKVGGEIFVNYHTINKFNNIDKEKSKENMNKIEDQVELLRIHSETCGEYESILIEMKEFADDFKNNEILEKRSSLQIRNCLREPGESLAVNINGNSKYSEHVKSSTSNFHNEYAMCSAGNKCCLICGRRRMDNPRYTRPVCRVKGGSSSPRLENDPWIKVMKKVVKHDNRKELISLIPRTPKNEALKNQELTEESSKNTVSSVYKNTTNEIPTEIDNESKSVDEMEDKKDEKCLNVIITEAEDPSPSMPSVGTNIQRSRADQSTSCCPPVHRSSNSFGFATFRGSRIQSERTYFMRESVRTGEVTANRLLCVISESESLMTIPSFLPEKSPDWFGRQMPTRRWSRR